ncbi:UbiA prenyltransferase family [Crucibulum laeve]|uniref:UbiA prenyltransferase family n=1 Tax=Crucibulum laeve TaxID=68775 RepID=A0A5C3LQI2_9AGAR|nr:UbiA prenyltransferase family [Crucibulum laeve]
MAAYSVVLPLKTLMFYSVAGIIAGTLVHSAACVWNDICDIEFDRQVERTKTRPLVTGAVSVKGAYILLFVLLAPSLLMLTVAILGLIGIFPLHGSYPFMKRWTWWPQIALGITMNWGYFVAWTAVCMKVKWNVVPVFFIGTICWSVVYDTIYACQDRKDDIRAGVKSTALLFGNRVRQILILFAVTFVACMYFAGHANHHGWIFIVISVGSACAFFIWQFYVWRVDDGSDCMAKFKANGEIGYAIWLGMALDYYYIHQSLV